MLYKTHLVFAILIALLLFNKFNIFLLIILILSSFIPDIDIQTSKIGKKFKILSFLTNKLFSHRGFFHSIILPLIFYFIFTYIFNLQEIGLVVFIGISSHLFLDMLTKEGIAFFSPFIQKKINGFITTGGILELILFLVILFFNFFIIFRDFL